MTELLSQFAADVFTRSRHLHLAAMLSLMSSLPDNPHHQFSPSLPVSSTSSALKVPQPSSEDGCLEHLPSPWEVQSFWVFTIWLAILGSKKKKKIKWLRQDCIEHTLHWISVFLSPSRILVGESLQASNRLAKDKSCKSQLARR